MKTIKYFISAVAIAFITTGCANDLNTLPEGDISGEQLNEDQSKPEKILEEFILIFAATVPEELLYTDFGIMAIKQEQI
jgi:hypothetical protein